MEGTFDLTLVSLSYVVAVAASYTALELARRVSSASGPSAKAWLVAGALSMGLGIWTMHFVGMLAFSMEMPFTYDVFTTVLSLFAGMLASAFAIYVASRQDNSFRTIGMSGVLLGGGICAMHYTGMAAMRMPASISYDPVLLALSILIAITAACAAIWIIAALTSQVGRRVILWKAGAALIMGIAICGMHYTGMAAAVYTPFDTEMVFGDGQQDNTAMAVILGIVALLILGFTQLTIFFDFKLSHERQLSQAAQERALRLSQVLDESTNEIYFFEVETLLFVGVNRGASDNTGFTEEELLEMRPTDLAVRMHEDHFFELLHTLVSGMRKELFLETTHRRRDDSEYQVQMHLQLSTVMETPVFVAIVADITEKKNLEAQLHRAQKLEAIGQLAAGIAHEINTPTQFVSDNVSFLREAVDDLLETARAAGRLVDGVDGRPLDLLVADLRDRLEASDLEYLESELPATFEQTEDGIDRIATIVRAIKEFSHPGESDRKLADINRGIQNTITVASNEWRYVADIETDFDDNLPRVMCFAQEVDQVVLNLIVNAAHAIEKTQEEGGDNVRGTIRIATRRLSKAVEITVSDTGCGIPESIKDRICDPFFTTKEVGKGTGQGLSMAHHTIVEKHGGALKIDSTEGEGSTFTIELPLETTPGRQDRPARMAGAPAISNWADRKLGA